MNGPLNRRWNRRGTTTVEFALVAPIFFTVIFAAIEFSRVEMLRQTCAIAAAEGARRGIVGGATAADCRGRALAELQVLGVRGATVSVTPALINPGSLNVTVTVNVPLAQNGYIFARFFVNRNLTASVRLQREVS